MGINIGLDWDGTVTSDPHLFLLFCKQARQNGHQVHIVTMRYVSECANIPSVFLRNVDGLHATGRQAKGPFMKARGINIDVWIDNNPKAVDQSAVEIWGVSSKEGDVVIESHGS